MSGASDHGSKYVEWILNKVDVGVHLIDQEGTTLFYNEKMAEIDGFQRDEVLGKNIFHLYPSLTEESSTLVNVLKTGKEILEKIQTYINITGKQITTINSTFPLCQEGHVIGALEVAKDITSIVQLHDQVLDLRQQLYHSQHKDKKQAGAAQYYFNDLIGSSPSFLETVMQAKKAARTSSPVLICGPTGTGKELFAQSIHNAGARRSRPFIAQNCAAVPAELMEGIMFGTSRGAFTGAMDRAGLFEQASGGTLFLDELNSLDLFLQAKLLRVLQDGIIRRVGGTSEHQVNVRIIAAMNMEPRDALERGFLRHDLYFRLNVVCLYIPPLSQRREDISLLAQHFIEKFNSMFGLAVTGISPSAMERLLAYAWPGNVRELRHALESTYNMMELGCGTIEEHHLPSYLRDPHPKYASISRALGQPAAAKSSTGSLRENIRRLEYEAILNALQTNHYNITLAAQSLGINRQALQYKMNRYGITRK